MGNNINPEQVFHQSAGTHLTPSNLAPTPFQMIGGAVKSAANSAGRVATKIATKLTAPIVRNIKSSDATDAMRRQKASTGDYNK